MTLTIEYKEFSVETHGSILHVMITGKLEVADYEILVPIAEQLIHTHGKIRIICEMHDFEGWTAGAFWEECKLAYHHLSDVERIAMVGERSWEEGLTYFMKPFTSAKLKYFDATERSEALDWIQKG